MCCLALWFTSQNLLIAQNNLVVNNQSKTATALREAASGLDYSKENLPVQKQEKSRNKEGENKNDQTEKHNNAKTENGFHPFYATLLLVVLALLLIAIIVYAVVKNRFLNSAKPVVIIADQESKSFAAMDLQSPLQLHLGEGNYRLACRVLYQQLLQELVSSNAIKWSTEKTNWDYYYEAVGNGKIDQNILKNITENYDVLWYGLKEPSKVEFDLFEKAVIKIRN